MRKAGYVFTTAPGAVRCVCHRLVGFGARAVPYADGKNALKWSRALLDATAVLNLMVPKDHDLAGVTGALKNLAFGSVDHVPEFHADIQRAIPWVYAQPEIRDKVRLCLCDASRVTYDGGPHDKPKTRAVCDAVLVAEDGVAMDWAVLELVNAERARRGLLGVERDARRRPDWLHNAANMALGARFADLRWRRIDDAGRASAWAPAHIDKAFSAGDPGPPRGG